MAKKEPEFIVKDRRKFTVEGELRDDVAVEEAPSKTKEEPKTAVAEAPQTPDAQSKATPPPPTAEEQSAQKNAYHDSSRKLDAMLDAAGHPRPENTEVNFQRVVEQYYMTALMQMGAIRMEGEEPRVDILGARQTIDTLGILNDKTKGNLTDAEQSLLQNALFEVRMLFLEITNAIAKQAAAGAPKAGTIRK